MAGTVGPQLEGSITIPTNEFSKAVAEFSKGADRIVKAANQMDKVFSRLDKSLGGMVRSYNETAKAAKQSSSAESKAAQQTSDLMDKKANAIARTSDKIRVMEDRVRKSNLSQERQAAILRNLKGTMQNYADNIKRGSMSAAQMDNANTELSTSLSRVKRELSNTAKASESGNRQRIADIKSLSQLQVSYDRTANAIAQSTMAEEKKNQTTARLRAVQNQASEAIRRFGGNSTQAASALAAFRQQAAQASINVRNVNAAARKRDLESWKSQMRDLSSSVQLALGPLSGIASRISALTALFNRNAAVVAGFIASLTGLSVAFTRSIRAGILAETTFLNLQGIVAGLGDKASMSAQDLYDLGTATGLAFLTSAKEGREAAGALATFGSVGRQQFDEVLAAAQGLTQVIGGDLRRNTIRLGRLMEDPAENFNTLTRYGITFTDAMQEQIITLRNQGKILEANELILKRFEFAQSAASDAAKGLAGQIDTAGETFGLIYEGLFNASGASEEATTQFAKLNKTLEEFRGSEELERLGSLFKGLTSVIGSTVNFAANNIQLISGALITLSVAVIPRFIVWITKATASMIGFGASIKATEQRVKDYRTGVQGATIATKGLSLAARALPFVGIAAGLAATIASMIAMRKEAKTTAESLDNSFTEFSDKLSSIPGLQQDIKDSFAETASGYKQSADVAQRNLKRTETDIKAVRDELNTLGTTIVSQQTGQKQTFFSTDEAKRAKQLTSELERLKDQQDQYNFSLELYTMKLDNVSVAAQQTADRNKELGFVMQSAIKSADELRNEFLKEEVQLEKLQEQLKRAVGARDNLESATGKLTDSERESLAVLNRIVPAIEKEIKKLNDSENAVKRKSRAYAELMNVQNEALSEIEIFNKQLEGMSDTELARFKGGKEVEAELKRISSVIQKMKDEELPEFAKQWGISLDGISSRKDQIAAITTAFNNQTGAILRQRNELELQAQAYENANETIEGSRTGFQALTTQYMNQLETLKALGVESNLYKEASAALTSQMKRDSEELANTVSDATRFQSLTPLEQLQEDYEQRKKIILEAHNWEEEAAKKHVAELDNNFKKQKGFLVFGETAKKAETMVTGAMEAMTAAGKEQSKDYQNMAIAQALIQQSQAIANIWAQPGGNIATKIAESAIAAFQVGAQIKQIRSQNFADGGAVRGPGTMTSDSIPAWLSNGEFVMNARAVQRVGMKNLEAMNEGKAMPRFSDGGPLKLSGMNNSGNYSSNGDTQFIVNNYASGVEVEQEERFDENGNRQLIATIKNVVNQGFRDGSFDTSVGMFGNGAGNIRRNPRGR